jgi:erythromycin esterase-like protein
MGGEILFNILFVLARLANELVQHLHVVAAPAAMQQHGQVLRQRAVMLQAANGIKNSIKMRDQMMADNIAWLLRQEPATKTVVWAHNIHIQRDKSYPLMGQYLSKQLGPAYVAVGFATGHGTASVLNPDGSDRALVLAPPLPTPSRPGSTKRPHPTTSST